MRTFVRRLVPVVGGRLFHLMKTGEFTGKAAYSIAAYSPSAVCGQQGRRYGGGPAILEPAIAILIGSPRRMRSTVVNREPSREPKDRVLVDTEPTTTPALTA
jgi:hypothetical protein